VVKVKPQTTIETVPRMPWLGLAKAFSASKPASLAVMHSSHEFISLQLSGEGSSTFNRAS
jgi:hypothetical protein